MIVTPIRTHVVLEGDDVFALITQYISSMPNKSIIAVTSKVVALAERRTSSAKTAAEKERLIRAESDVAIPTKYVWLTIKDHMVLPSAGIDESNGNGKLVLLPRDSFRAATVLRKKIMHHYGVRDIGIIITDSRTAPLRAGITGVALGYSGFAGIRDYRQSRDIFGRCFHYSRVNVADSLATAAVLTMGEGAEQCPLAIIADAPVTFRNTVRKNELRIDPADDMYLPFLDKLARVSRRRRGRS